VREWQNNTRKKEQQALQYKTQMVQKDAVSDMQLAIVDCDLKWVTTKLKARPR